MKKCTRKFVESVGSRVAVSDLSVRNDSNPFRVRLTCDFPGIGLMTIEPFQEKHFESFRHFYDRCDPEWDLSAESRALCDQHDTSSDTLSEIVRRVASEEDARFLICTHNHVIGYILIEEIGRIKAGEKTFFGEDYYAELDIAVSDRFHGTGLASFSMLFLKLVAAIAGVGLGLITSPENERAISFYIKHGFAPAGHKDIYIPHTGERTVRQPWYLLEKNELEEGKAPRSRRANPKRAAPAA
jgi:ribosomal protein S18 acetylase RimI-like enzyme